MYFYVLHLISFYISGSYEQGVRRMTLAFSNSVIHSSAVEEPNSSEDECNPKELSGNELQKHLKNISSFNKLNPKITEHKTNYGSFYN